MNKGQTPERIQPLTVKQDSTLIATVSVLESVSQRRTREQLIDRETAKPGLRGFINAKCVECLYDESEPGSWRQQVEACTCPNCPLFAVRPRSEKCREATL